MSKFKIGFVAAVILSVACSLNFFLKWRPIDYQMDEMPCEFDSKPRTYHHMRQKSCPTTFVTQYFQIPSKHSLSEYMEWIRNLHDADICLLVFTDSPHLWHGQRHAVIKTSICAEGVALNRSECFWREQWYKDPEAFIHRGFYLYIAWNLKPYFLSEAVRINSFSSQYFFWIDAGYARAPIDLKLSTQVPIIPRTRVVFFIMGQFSEAELAKDWFHYTINQDRLEGGLFGGRAEAVMAWVSLYYNVLQQFVSRDWFVGKDQNLMNTVCIRYPTACALVKAQTDWGENPWLITHECLTSKRTCLFHDLHTA